MEEGSGGRQRFEVELRPEQTTIVSWKKLLKDANKNKPPRPLIASHPALDPRNAPHSGEFAGNEANDAPPGSRFTAVIEKIGRLYMGKNSSDEEDLNDVPDDDEYDSGDSFIDDGELDEYFEVDNSAIKHDGFFVNRGKLELMPISENEPTALPSQQQKKRRRKDLANGYGGNDDGHGKNKHMKVNKKAAGKVSVGKNSTSLSQTKASPTVNCEEMKHQTPTIALGTIVKKSSGPTNMVDPSPTGVSDDEAIMTAHNIDKHKSGVLQLINHGNELKDGSPSSPVPSQGLNDRSSNVQLKSDSGRLHGDSEELNQSDPSSEKNVISERSEFEAPRINQQTPQKNPLLMRKEGSSTKPKSTILEKAIRDLETTVAESRPPSMEFPDADNSSQAVKRRMPPEIKQKLAKVARLAHTIHGRILKELLSRLMSILGHLIQLRSLKRNLINMVNMGLSAKKEKDARLQQLKKEVGEMVKIRAPMMKPKALEQQVGTSDDFQETSTKEKEVLKTCTMDDTLEDKICDLYDLFVDGLDEDAGPLVRKLYAELAELWPKGFMDNHGIKRAICRAKNRRKTLYRHKDQEKSKRKKLLAPKNETVHIEAVAQPQSAPDSNGSISNTLTAITATRMPNSSMSSPKMDMPK